MLDILDYLVDKGNMNIWSSISSKKFFQGLLDLLRTRDIPEVQMKLLGLIQKWGLNFEDKRSALPNFYSVYNKLRNSNVQFPNNFESNYQIYISNSSTNNYNKNNNNYDRNDDQENENSDKDDGETFYYMDSLKNKLKVPNFEHKYRRLVNFLVKMHDNIQMANLLMDSRERSGLKDIINTLREGNNTLIDTISGGRLKDEKLMEITLGTTEDINQTLNRDEDIKNGYKPKKFTSYFVLNNVIPIKGNNSRSRARSTKPKKSSQRRDERYKNYDMDLNGYDKNKYKEKMGAPKNVDDIFDLFSASSPSNEPGYNQNNNNQPINNFFSSQTQIRGNNNNNQYPELRNNPINNLFNSNNNRNTMMGNNNNLAYNNNFQGNNQNNNNYGGKFNQYNNQQRPVMTNFDILEQKLNNLNFQQKNHNFNFNSQSTQTNKGFNNNNNNMNNNNNNNLMNMLDQLGPSPQGDTNQLVPYIGNFNQNNNNMNNNNLNNNNMNNNNFMNNNDNNNSQFNNINNNNNNPQFNNFNNYNNNNNNRYGNNQFNNFNNNNINKNFNNNSNNFNNNNNNHFNNNQNNFGNNNDNNMFNMQNNNNQMNFDRNLGISQNMNNNNFNNNDFGMNQNNNQQMNLEEIEKQQKLKELDDLF